MKDERKMHKRVSEHYVWLECDGSEAWRRRRKTRWSLRWRDVTCENCLKHKPKIRLGKVASDEIRDVVSKRRRRSGLMHRETLRDGTRFFVPKWRR